MSFEEYLVDRADVTFPTSGIGADRVHREGLEEQPTHVDKAARVVRLSERDVVRGDDGEIIVDTNLLLEVMDPPPVKGCLITIAAGLNAGRYVVDGEAFAARSNSQTPRYLSVRARRR